MLTPVAVHNTLPSALRHYEGALVDVLQAVGRQAAVSPAVNAEIGRSGGVQRILRAVREVQAVGRAGRDVRDAGSTLINCWPTFGLLEPVLWARAARRARIGLVIHDPRPLRRQLGTGPISATLGGLVARRSPVEVIVHSHAALRALEQLGWPAPTLLPHPITPTAPAPRDPGGEVVVLGQYKPARDLDLLRDLSAPLHRAGWRAVVRGRGWPELPGWDDSSAFLTEAEFDASIRAADVLLVPYRHFFQSGIAIRAVEYGVPVVGPRHSFLVDLLGEDWPGLVDGQDPLRWAAAVAAAAAARDRVPDLARAYRRRCEDAWGRHLDGSPGGI